MKNIEELKKMTFEEVLNINTFGIMRGQYGREELSRHIIMSIDGNGLTPLLALIFKLNDGTITPLNNDKFNVVFENTYGDPYKEVLTRTQIYSFLSNYDYGCMFNDGIEGLYKKVSTINKGFSIGDKEMNDKMTIVSKSKLK